MVDDTDYPKRGIQTELIGKIYSHVTHSMMLGFKGLFIGITDGVSQMLLDFALVGEEGKNGNYGLKQKQLDARFSKEHGKESHTAKRIEEYNQSKIALMIEMIRRIIKRKIHFDYVLADSWFACAEIILFITSRHVRCHYLGMIKMGKTKYVYKGKEYTANQLAAIFDKPKQGRKYSRRLGCWYITVDVIFAGCNVRLFFSKRDKRGKWNGLITTNRKLDFFEDYRIYSRRWSLEVFKWLKQHLRIKEFYGTTENAVKIQIYAAIAAYCLVVIVQEEMKLEMDTYDVLRILNSTLLTKMPLINMLNSKISLEKEDSRSVQMEFLFED